MRAPKDGTEQDAVSEHTGADGYENKGGDTQTETVNSGDKEAAKTSHKTENRAEQLPKKRTDPEKRTKSALRSTKKHSLLRLIVNLLI